MLGTWRKLFSLMERRERRRFAGLLVLITFMGLMDLAGVASILPFLAVLAAPEVVTTNPILSSVYDRMAFRETHDFLVFLGFVTFGLIVVGQAVKAFTMFRLHRFVRQNEYALSGRLLAHYLHQPYPWFLNRHSAELGRSVLTEVGQVTHGALVPALRMLAQLVILFFLIILLVSVSPLAALISAVVIGTSYAVIFFSARRYLNRLGKDRLAANTERFVIAQEALGAIKTVKLMRLEESFLKRFRKAADQYASRQASAVAVSELPRFLLEAIVYGGMILLLLVLLTTNDGELEAAIPVLGVFAFAGVRIFPALQQIYGGFASIRFNMPSLDALIQDLDEMAEGYSTGEEKIIPVALHRSLELRDVTYAYPKADRTALVGLSMVIEANTTVGLVGSTGAGKTTAVDIILGLLVPQNGSLLADDVVIDRSRLRGWQSRIGYVPQDIFLSDASIAENIAFGVAPDEIDMAAVERAARMAELHHFVVEEQPAGYHTLIGERGVRLSGGQRQRIGIARALYHDPDLLVLDEATSSLDTLTERAVMDAVHNLGHRKTIIIIAHRLSTVRGADNIFMLEKGACVASGSYDELVANNSRFRQLATATALEQH